MVSAICQEILQNGVCQTEGCRAKHDVHVCSLCRVICPNQRQLSEHLAGKKHRNAVAGTSGPVWCRACNIELFSKYLFTYHARSARHRHGLVYRPQEDSGLCEVKESDETVFCETCDAKILTEFWDIHINSQRHRNGRIYSTLKGALHEAEKNKNGIVVQDEDGIDLGIIDPEVEYSYSISVDNTTSTTIKLTSASMTSSHQRNRLMAASQ